MSAPHRYERPGRVVLAVAVLAVVLGVGTAVARCPAGRVLACLAVGAPSLDEVRGAP